MLFCFFFFGSFYFIRFLSQYKLQIFHLFCFKGGCLTRRPLWSLRSLSFVAGQLLFYQHCVFASKIKLILILAKVLVGRRNFFCGPHVCHLWCRTIIVRQNVFMCIFGHFFAFFNFEVRISQLEVGPNLTNSLSVFLDFV